ncbi:hypothetical protein MNBD_ALPHA12-693 [hydrothermal vent metagenome]|uniref:Uncharacterized protein n=1 Tax=hydrothermal vent metagenome TaxID=652676 RepID=A0A3B0TUV1_9ZZZZ
MPPSNSNHSRKRAEKRGRSAETIALWFLRAQLFSILERRFKTPGGEIDIIARRGQMIVFVEVKMRKSGKLEYQALAGVNQRRILNAARFFLANNPSMADKILRFDVIFLAPWSWPRHVRNAFGAFSGVRSNN